MIELGVNIDHVATLRQARRTYEPDPVWAAVEAHLGGADGITVHLREDRRHIQDADVRRLKDLTQIKLNLEMAATDEMVGIACALKPELAMFVPEGRHEVTTEGGLDVVANFSEIKKAVETLRKNEIFVSLFIDPEGKQIRAAAKLNVFQVEFCTASYAHLCESPGSATVRNIKEIEAEIQRIKKASRTATQAKLNVAAGHGLTYRNIAPIAQIEEIEEFNIGHNIIARSALVGLDRAVREMISAIRGA